MSKTHLAPYINFQGSARDAMEHYHRILGGKLDLFASDNSGKPQPAGPGDRIMYARLEADGIIIIASDGNPKYPATVGDHIGLSIGGPDRDRLTTVFNALAEGGQVKMPLTDAPWGTSGWLADRFGITWNVDIDKG
jgi:PhnB protein